MCMIACNPFPNSAAVVSDHATLEERFSESSNSESYSLCSKTNLQITPPTSVRTLVFFALWYFEITLNHSSFLHNYSNCWLNRQGTLQDLRMLIYFGALQEESYLLFVFLLCATFFGSGSTLVCPPVPAAKVLHNHTDWHAQPSAPSSAFCSLFNN